MSGTDSTPQDLEHIRSVKRAYEDELLSKANVVGVGVGLRQAHGKQTETPAIVVMVSQKLPPHRLDPQDLIPREIEGVPVDVQIVGEIRAF